MNPYVQITLVMCAVIFIALFATAYMAMYFTRRAKADLEAALIPLAAVLDGSQSIEEAHATGRYEGKLAFGRMANAEGGPVRVFQTEVIDAAGGESWLYVRYPAKGVVEFRPEGSPLKAQFPELSAADLPQTLGTHTDWIQIEYSAEGGHVRLTVPMDTRKDIPSAEVFRGQLAWLDQLSDHNRALQQGASTNDA